MEHTPTTTLERQLIARAAALRRPVSGSLELTPLCNMNCRMCYVRLSPGQARAAGALRTGQQWAELARPMARAGVLFLLLTGGEPLLRKKDIIRLCEKHRDMAFHAFTNGTLIDEEFCQEMLRVGNFFVSISVEGFEEANDGRRGRGHFQKKALDAMDLMRSHRIPFGVSICYTSRNYKVVTSDEFLDLLISKGCVFAWYFHYMPVGLNADTSLLLTPEQRTYMKDRVREIRGVTSGKELYCIASISATLYGVMEAFSFTPMPSCRRARIFSVTRPNMGRPHRRS